MHEVSNKTLREQLLQTRKTRRDQLTSSTHFEYFLSKKILMAIEEINTIYSTKIKNIAFYWPIRGELDLRAPLLAWQQQASDRHLALPVAKANQPLAFYTWQENTPMVSGYANIPEPQGAQEITPDLILCPCVGWYFAHHQLWRLGYGGGFYDRTMHHFSSTKRPFLLGIAFDSLMVEDRAVQPHAQDFPLHGVFTESSLYLMP